MTLRFTGTFEELKNKLSTLGGDWNEDYSNKRVLRLNGGVLNWFSSTGTLHFQGRNPGLEQLRTEVPRLLYPNEYAEPNEETLSVVNTTRSQSRMIKRRPLWNGCICAATSKTLSLSLGSSTLSAPSISACLIL